MPYIYKLCWADKKYRKPHTTMYLMDVKQCEWFFERNWEEECAWIELINVDYKSSEYKQAEHNLQYK